MSDINHNQLLFSPATLANFKHTTSNDIPKTRKLKSPLFTRIANFSLPNKKFIYILWYISNSDEILSVLTTILSLFYIIKIAYTFCT